MHNIWEFLLQTLSVSVTAALLLIVKALLADKLPPRWQYGIWAVLALRIVLPAPTARGVLLPLPLWAEQGKALAEAHLQSAYAAPYRPLSLRAPLPWLTQAPQSVTDWLFVLYTAGIAAALLWYLAGFVRLRLLLARCAPAPAEMQAHVDAVAAEYGLAACRAVSVPGLPSAFVCGAFRPVLALPAEAEPDELVLLHELLHLRYRDALQSALWCLLRALHWCNPFLHYVFDRIGNDMESLCDQRVLERIEGERRRDYGRILLSMANERYPRAPGTTSLSNGGRSIARRIEAIVRFRKYPRGMALASVCVAVLLACPVLAGTESSLPSGVWYPDSEPALQRSLAAVRLHRCTTPAGALGCYIAGVTQDNGVLLAMASPLSEQETLARQMAQSAADGWVPFHLEGGWELTYARREGCVVYDLTAQPGGGYTAVAAVSVSGVFDEKAERWLTDGESDAQDGVGESQAGTVLLSITLAQADGGWVVREHAPRRIVFGEPTDALAPLQTASAQGQYLQAALHVHTAHGLGASFSPGGVITAVAGSDLTRPDPGADFTYAELLADVRCRIDRAALPDGVQSVAVEGTLLHTTGGTPVFHPWQAPSDGGWSAQDSAAEGRLLGDADWDGTLSLPLSRRDDTDIPVGCAVQLTLDGTAAETLTLREDEA